MTVVEEKNTRERILTNARRLFAEKGYAGTSIREIAGDAEVNVAAINYHFKSKETLWFEVLRDGYQIATEEINALECGEEEAVSDFALKVYKVFTAHSDITLNSMKIMLSAQPSKMEDFGLQDEEFGPPGSMKLFTVLESKLKTKPLEKDAVWFVHTVFALVFHKATMMVSPCTLRPSMQRLLEKTDVEQDLKRAVDVLFKAIEEKYS